VTTASSATGALERIKSHGIQAIVSDYQMPGMDGIEFLKQVRVINKTIPFIFFAGKGREDIAVEAFENGADDYVQKGDDPESQFDKLVHKIRAAVDRRRDEQNVTVLNRLSMVLSATNKAIVRIHDKKELLTEICRISVDKGGFAMVWAGRLNGRKGLIEPVGTSGRIEGFPDGIALSTDDISQWSSPTGTACRTGIVYTCNDLESDPTTVPWREEALKQGYRSLAAVPFAPDTGNAGVITFYASEPGLFDERVIRLLEEQSEDISFALQILDREEQRAAAEHELKRSELRYRRLYESAQEAILILDGDTGEIIDANASLEKMLGYTVVELSRTGFSNLVYPFDQQKIKRWIKNLISDTSAPAIETKFIHRDQRTISAKVTASLIRFPDGSPWYCAIEIQNDSDRQLAVDKLTKAHDKMEKRVQKRTAELKKTNTDLQNEIIRSEQLVANLQESEAIYRSIGDLVPFGVWLCDANGEATYFSDSFLDLVGSPMDVCRGTGWIRHLHPDDEKKTLEDWLRCVESGKNWDYEYRIRDPAGACHTVLSRGAPIRDNEGQITSWAGINLDITDRQNAEKERAHLAAIVTSSDDAIIGKSLDGTIFSWNASAERVYGYTARESIGMNISMLVPPGRENDTSDILEKIRRDEPVLHYETVMMTKDGRNIDISLTASPIKDSRGKIVGLSSIGRDITDTKHIQEILSASLREKEMLLKEIHHRVKNNIQVISSLLSMQSRIAGDQVVKNVLKEAQDRVKSIALIHEKLCQSKSLDWIDYQDYLEKISRHLSSSYCINPGTIVVHVNAENVSLNIDKAVPCSLIINELLSNAFKHAFPDGRKGEVDLTITAEDDQFIIRYKDDGIGLPDGFSMDNSTSLGMQLLAGLTGQLKGTILFENGNGTRCTIRFPA
jgi:PAS domain S-box-containing protein